MTMHLEKIRRFKPHWVIMILFGVIIYTPLLSWDFSDVKKMSLTEKRKLASCPALPDSIDTLKTFPTEFEAYFKDQFSFRDEMVKLHNRFKFFLGDSSTSNVIFGKKGWLFLSGKAYFSPVRDYRNLDPFTPVDLQNYVKYLKFKQQWLKKRGIKYLFFVAPNKHTIYGELLPDYITKVNKESALDQLMDYLAKNTDIPVLDLRPVLIENKNNTFCDLYGKFDTHWNFFGANFAQYEIAKKNG